MSNVMLLAGTINLSGSWNQVWGAVQTAIGTKLTTLLSAVGVILVVGAVFKWLFERRRGGGAATSTRLSAAALTDEPPGRGTTRPRRPCPAGSPESRQARQGRP